MDLAYHFLDKYFNRNGEDFFFEITKKTRFVASEKLSHQQDNARLYSAAQFFLKQMQIAMHRWLDKSWTNWERSYRKIMVFSRGR